MRKTLAGIVLAIALTMGMTTTALAATSDGVQASGEQIVKLPWTYVTSNGETPSTYPAELVSVSVSEYDSSNPDSANHKVVKTRNLTVGAVNNDIQLTLPSYDLVGEYSYTLKLAPYSGLGVTRAEDEIFVTMKVVASFNNNHDQIVSEAFFFDESGAKITGIVSTFDLGSLEVNNLVEGNLGSRSDEFVINVSFQSVGSSMVKNDIVYYLPGDPEPKVIAGADIGLTKPTVVPITLKHDESVIFSNIPAGMTYAVAETAPDGYTVTISEHDGIISADEADEVTVTNTKNASINTGVFLDNMPIVMAAAVAIAGAVALAALKRRRANR